jgi:Ca2+/Na+ antiporter
LAVQRAHSFVRNYFSNIISDRYHHILVAKQQQICRTSVGPVQFDSLLFDEHLLGVFDLRRSGQLVTSESSAAFFIFDDNQMSNSHHFLQTVSIRFGLSEELIGLTILAWGNASLDLFADVEIVLANKPRVAFAATISAPLISLLLGVGIPACIRFASQPALKVLPLHMSPQMLLISASVTVGLVLTSLVLICSRFQVYRPYGALLIIFYVLTMAAEFTLEYGFWSIPSSLFDSLSV